jgi:Family of unknown function (DUF5788)
MSDEILSKYERENFLLKLEKEFAFAGATIPAEVEASGERILLRAFVFETSKKRGKLTPEETAEVDRVIALLKQKRREITARISREEITRSEAQNLYAQARGLDRALDSLYSAPLPKPSIKEESRRAKMEDGRRWLNLVRKVYSHEEKRKRD